MQLTADQLRFVNRPGPRTWLCIDRREGKTTGGAWLLARHILRDYPEWYTGNRFTEPIKALCLGPTLQVVRDCTQPQLMRELDLAGAHVTAKLFMRGVPGCIDRLTIDGSSIDFRSTEQGYDKFQGCRWDFIWCDETRPFRDMMTRPFPITIALTETPLW